LEIQSRPDDIRPMAGVQALRMDGEVDPDLEVLHRAAAGEHPAALELFRAHGPRVHRTASRILGRDDAEVDDVVQQTFLAALDGASSFDGRSSVSTWLVGIATRRSLDAARSRARRNRWAKLGSFLGLPGIAEPAAPDGAHEHRSLVERALAELTIDQRAVFVLSAVEGHTLEEIRAMTGTGVSTLHARLTAARKRLDAFLAASGEELRS
jgi:RNA polymerase sigma-70 factor (ECF subfamily)